MRVLYLAALLLLISAGCGTAAKDAAPSPGAGFEERELPVLRAAVLQVESVSWPEIVKTQGSLVADEVTVVGAKVGGRVAQVHVDLGDVIPAGAKLATLDQAEFHLEVALAEAQRTQARAALGLTPADPLESLVPENSPPVREAKAVWDEAQTRLERTRALAARNAVTQNEFNQAVADEGVAAARMAAALNGVREKIALIGVREAELSVAVQRLADTEIVAPFAGLVQQRHAAPGAYLQVGQSVVTLLRASKLRFRGTVPERLAHRLTLGRPVLLRIESALEPRELKITRISPGVEESNRSLIFEAEIDNTQGTLRAGMFAEAEIVLDAAARAVVVPASAVGEFAGVEKVWRVSEGVAREIVVETGRRRGAEIEIAVGLVPGDTILADADEGKLARVEPTSTRPVSAVLASLGRSSGGAAQSGAVAESNAGPSE